MRRLLAATVLALALLSALVIGVSGSGAKGPGFRLHKVGAFDEPVYVTAPAGDRHRVFVVEQPGRIEVVKDGVKQAEPFLDISDKVDNDLERGLLSMAFPPDYATSQKFYVFYTDKDTMQRVEEYHASSALTADPASARPVLIEDDPAANNNGGQLQFGPDKRLYIANGDGGGEEAKQGDKYHNAQNLGSVFGKILRIDPSGDATHAYTVPADNPFQGEGQAPEIYLRGLRNPWRFSFDRKTGALIVADVGRGQQEEVDYFKRGTGKGANLGWPAFEGRAPYLTDTDAPGAVRPVLTRNHDSDGFCAITGGYVSRDPNVPATLGRYLFGDFCRGDIFSGRLKQPTTTAKDTGVHIPQLVSFGEDGRGRVYAVSIGGPVYRIGKAR